MKYIYLTLSFLSLGLYAQDSHQIKVLNVDRFCTGSSKVVIDGVDLAIRDDGFCKALSEIKKENKEVDASFIEDINYSLNYIQKSNELISHCDSKRPLVTNHIVTSRLNDYTDQKKDKWKLRFYASHSFTTYFATDLHINSSRYKGTILDYQWSER